ncbi:MAG: hypothetical protein JW955_06420, partial [Sedimentisphaerales bacterium]|nr:hypothetical protein [Sedimentisphaerales bacterium]
MVRNALVTSVVAIACLCAPVGVGWKSDCAAGAGLSQGFRDPPISARPSVYWVWVNGLTDKRQMTWELEELKAKGIGGVYIFDVGAQDPQKIVPAG